LSSLPLIQIADPIVVGATWRIGVRLLDIVDTPIDLTGDNATLSLISFYGEVITPVQEFDPVEDVLWLSLSAVQSSVLYAGVYSGILTILDDVTTAIAVFSVAVVR
jgi:hypothetical protein